MPRERYTLFTPVLHNDVWSTESYAKALCYARMKGLRIWDSWLKIWI